MSRPFNHRSVKFLLATGFSGILLTLSTPSHAQMANNPWGFQPQNRASVAALIRQVERENKNAGVMQLAPSNLVCGSDGKSAASGNSTCVILNNSTGHIEIGQDSEGDQTATSATDEQTTVQTQSDADDVLATLNGTQTR